MNSDKDQVDHSGYRSQHHKTIEEKKISKEENDKGSDERPALPDGNR